jgi:hypothetical protein
MIYSFTNPVDGPAPFLCTGDVLEPDKILRVFFEKLPHSVHGPRLLVFIPPHLPEWHFPESIEKVGFPVNGASRKLN